MRTGALGPSTISSAAERAMAARSHSRPPSRAMNSSRQPSARGTSSSWPSVRRSRSLMGSTQLLGKGFFSTREVKMARMDSRKRRTFRRTASTACGSVWSRGKRRVARSGVTTRAATRKETNSCQDRSCAAGVVLAKSRARRPAMRWGVSLESDRFTGIERSGSLQITRLSSEAGYTTTSYVFAAKGVPSHTRKNFQRRRSTGFASADRVGV